MSEMNLAAIDLNLLVVFEALLAERSAVGAGRRLGLSQPAVSHALGRLRLLLGDPLFVRAARGMTPTPRALELAPALAEVLAATRRLLAPRHGFQPALSQRTFVIGMPDYAAFLLLPGLLARVRQAAPGVTLLVRHASRATAFDLLEQGRIDMVAGNLADAKPPLAAETLFADELVCALRRDHPVLAGLWSLDAWLALDHLNVSLAGETEGYVDEVLDRHGRRRRVVATIGHFLLAPHLVAASDLVATEPRRVLAPLAERLGLALRPVPFTLAGFSVSLAWHTRVRGDDGYGWLRAQLIEEARGMQGSVHSSVAIG